MSNSALQPPDAAPSQDAHGDSVWDQVLNLLLAGYDAAPAHPELAIAKAPARTKKAA